MRHNKALSLLSISAAVVALASCTPSTGSSVTGGSSSTGTTGPNVRITMLTDVGTIDDKSFNQGTWEGVKAWGQANGLSETTSGAGFNYIRPNAGTTADYESAIDDAVAGGANVIVSPGYLFQTAFETKTVQYPNVNFVGIDFAQGNIAETPNSINILFKEQDAGFLAGYAAGQEGLIKNGFVGGMQIPAVIRYGAGYAAGLAYSNSLGDTSSVLTADHIFYAGAFEAKPDFKTKVTGWYTTDQLDVVFSAAGGVNINVFDAVDDYHTANSIPDGQKPWAIGVDVDQYAESDNVLTSAMKGLAVAVQDALDNIVKDNASEGGKVTTLGAAQDAAGLPTAAGSWRFDNFTTADYDAVLAKVKSGDTTVKIPSAVDDGGAELAGILSGYGWDETAAAALAAAIVPLAAD